MSMIDSRRCPRATPGSKCSPNASGPRCVCASFIRRSRPRLMSRAPRRSTIPVMPHTLVRSLRLALKLTPIQRGVALHHRREAELALGALARGGAGACAQPRTVAIPGRRTIETVSVAAIVQKSAHLMLHELGIAADLRGDDRAPARHRFEERVADPLVQRRQNEYVTCSQA